MNEAGIADPYALANAIHLGVHNPLARYARPKKMDQQMRQRAALARHTGYPCSCKEQPERPDCKAAQIIGFVGINWYGVSPTEESLEGFFAKRDWRGITDPLWHVTSSVATQMLLSKASENTHF